MGRGNPLQNRGAERHRLRRATLEDMPSIAALHRATFFCAMPQVPTLHTPEEDLRFYVTVVYPRAQIWVCELQEQIVGFIAFCSGWIEHLYIHPDRQRCGIGSALLAVAQAAEPRLRLWTFQCNWPARRFYEAHGFAIEEMTDGATNEERQPDILYHWSRLPN